jgi:hydroxymethylbilane synthase
MVAGLLAHAGIACEIVLIKTTGDRILDRSLADAGGKGLFVKELEEALLANRIDIAVHSMKDVPVALPDGLALAAVLPREDPEDVFLSAQAGSLAALAPGARLGTSSVRRTAQVLRARPDISCVLLRGNVDTRLAKLDAGEMDAIILARAGLKRLGLTNRITTILPTDEWLPSLAQGAVGIEIRNDDAQAAAVIAPLEDPVTAIELECERAFQGALDGSCRTPIAGLARLEAGQLCFRGEVLAPDGTDWATTTFSCVTEQNGKFVAARAGREAGETLKPRAAGWLAL